MFKTQTYSQRLKGSPTRDAYKYWHKNSRGGRYRWATAMDLDLILINKVTKEVSAIFDMKAERDRVTPTERIGYTDFESRGIPVYIIRIYGKWENWKITCDKCGRYEYIINEEEIDYITIKRYKGKYVKVNGKSKLFVEDYWEVERALRGFKNIHKKVVVENT